MLLRVWSGLILVSPVGHPADKDVYHDHEPGNLLLVNLAVLLPRYIIGEQQANGRGHETDQEIGDYRAGGYLHNAVGFGG